MGMERKWFTTAEAARELELTHSTIREAISRGRLKAEKVAPRLLAVMPDELERYRAEHLHGHGWDKRKADNYTPNQKAAEYAKAYRQRKKERQSTRKQQEEGAGQKGQRNTIAIRVTGENQHDGE